MIKGSCGSARRMDCFASTLARARSGISTRPTACKVTSSTAARRSRARAARCISAASTVSTSFYPPKSSRTPCPRGSSSPTSSSSTVRWRSGSSCAGNQSSHRPIVFTDSIKLSHRDNIFSFEFAALHFSAPQKERVRLPDGGIQRRLDSHWRAAKICHLYQPGPRRLCLSGQGEQQRRRME